MWKLKSAAIAVLFAVALPLFLSAQSAEELKNQRAGGEARSVE